MDMAQLIDTYLPIYQFSETHDCIVGTDPARTIQIAAEYEPQNDRFFRFVIDLREAPMRLHGLLTGKNKARSDRFGMQDFTLLGRSDDALVYGLIGQFWKLNYGLRPVADGNDFVRLNDTDAAKLVLSFSAWRQADGRTRLVTQTRVFCPNRTTHLKFLPYWLLIRPVSGLIRRRILSSIKRRSDVVSGSFPM